MKALILIILFIPVSTQSFAQITGAYRVTGTVSDSLSKEKLNKASILLSNNAVLIRSQATDTNGSFSFNNIMPGKYILEISYVGFEPVKRHIEVKNHIEVAIELARSNTSLSDFTVTQQKKLIIQTQDGITYNISEGAITASDNLYNIILKVAGVTESNNSLFYQGKPINILLDAKSNNLSGKELKEFLMGLHGTNTDKLEILLNPSARYDAQGGAVFNIKSVKNKNFGFTESVTAGVGTGTYFRNTNGFSVNYRDSTINIYGSYDFNYNKQFFLLHALESFTSNSATINLIDNNRRSQNNHSVKFGIDYDLNKNTVIGILFKGFQNYRRRIVENTSVYNAGNNLPDTVASVGTITNAVYKSPSLNIFIRSRLNKKGTELILNADYLGYNKNWSDDFITVYTDRTGKEVSPTVYMTDHSPANNSVKSVTADLTEPLKTGRVEVGFKASRSKTDNDVVWQRLLGNEWKTDLTKTNHFIYEESVYATYINLVQNGKKWNLQAGLRYELTKSQARSMTLNSNKENSYDNIFPSLSVQFKPGKTQEFSFSYRRSIQRFGFDIINPFIIYQSEYSYNQGNPNIKPAFFNSVGLSYMYKNKFILNTGYTSVKNPISYGYKKDDTRNILFGSYFNFGDGRLINGSISYTEKILRGKWVSSNSFNFLHSEQPDFEGYIIVNNSYGITTTNNIQLSPKMSLEFTGFYTSALFDGTVKQDAIYGLSAGISRSILQSKGSLKLSCTDIFNTQIAHFNALGGGIKLVSDWKVESRFINLLFIYRFGSLSIKANRNRNTSIEDEKMRMGAR